MIGQVRTAHPSIMLNGFEYFNKLEPYFVSMAYVDSADGQTADDLHLQLADRDNRFISDWMPGKGVFLDVGIVAEQWYSPNAVALNLDCGRLWIDEIEFELPQHTVSIKASSIPTSSYLKATDQARGWDNTTLMKLAQQIVDENKAAGLTLDYEAQYNPSYSRIEQTEQSSLEFLMHRCRDAGLAIKLHRGKLVIFDEAVIEATAPSFSIVFGQLAAAPGMRCFRMSGGKFTTRLIDTMKQVTVSHVDPASGKAHYETAIAGDADAADDWHTNVNQATDEQDEEDGGSDDGGDTRDDAGAADSWSGAGASASDQRLAKAKLRHHNKDQVHAQIDLSIGCPLIASGQTFLLVGVGNYDGKWFAEKIEHKCGPMFTTSLTARKCLVGY